MNVLRSTMLICLFSLCQLTLVGTDAPPPILEITIGDGTRLVQHWHDSIFFKTWSSPALAAIRAKLDDSIAAGQGPGGFDPAKLLTSLVNARLQVRWSGTKADPPPEATPEVRAQFDVGSQATTLLHILSDKGTAATVAGADEAFLRPDGDYVWARFGTVLAFGPKGMVLSVTPIPHTDHDISMRVDGAALASAVLAHSDPADAKQAAKILTILKPIEVPSQIDIDVTADGFHTMSLSNTTLSWLIPTETSWLNHLPENAYSVSAIGIDGAPLWKDLVQPLLSVAAEKDGKTVEQVIEQIQAMAHEAGLDINLASVVSGIKGTIFTANTPGAPFPGVTIGIPRSLGIDQIVAFGLKALQNTPPAEGQSTSLIIPNLPIPINLICGHESWIISSDAILASSWGNAPTTDWSGSPLGKLTASKVDADVWSFSISDTVAELRTMQGYLALALPNLPFDAPVKQAILNGLSQIIANAGLSYQVSRQKDHQIQSDGQGLLGVGSSSVFVVGVIAAIAIPNLLESKVAANQAAAVTSLKSEVFPAEVQFQAGAYHDRDKDGIGDFGFFTEMSGGAIDGKAGLTLSLLPKSWNADTPSINGYHFAVFLPDGKGGALSIGHDHDIVGGNPGDSPESNFVAYAWPDASTNGRMMYAITAAGVVYSAPFKTGDPPPAWNSLFGTKTWKDPITWQAFTRGNARGPRTKSPPQAPPTPKKTGVTDF